MRTTGVLVSVFGFVCAVAAAGRATIPSPRPTGWVVDQAGLLATDAVAELNRFGDAVHARDGAMLAVLTVTSTDGAAPRTFATQVFNHWQLGDRAAEIVLGGGIDGAAYVAKSDRIMRDEIVSRFRRGENAAALPALPAVRPHDDAAR